MTAWPAEYRRLILDSVDSTNAEAARRAADPGTETPLWILAHRQTAGRGRHGRAWSAPAGNLNATLLCRPALETGVAAQLSFAACLATADFLAWVAPRAEVRLKWPNDALLNGAKVAGILLESAGRGRRPDWLAIGIGVNLQAAPGTGEIAPGHHPPTSLTAEGGTPLTPEAALTYLAARYAHWQVQHARAGFAPLRAAWLARAVGLGQRLTARLAGTSMSGVFEDMDGAGRLVLRTPSGLRRVAAADLLLPE